MRAFATRVFRLLQHPKQSVPVSPVKHDDRPHSLPPVNELLPSTAARSVPDKRKNGGISKKQLRRIKHQVSKGLKPAGKKYAVVEVFCPPRSMPEVEKFGSRGLFIDK